MDFASEINKDDVDDDYRSKLIDGFVLSKGLPFRKKISGKYSITTYRVEMLETEKQKNQMTNRYEGIDSVVGQDRSHVRDGKLFLHDFCLVAQMSMRTRTTFPLTE